MNSQIPKRWAGVAAALAATILLPACSLPRDPGGTTDRVEQTGILRLGLIEATEFDRPSRDTLRRVLDRTGARVEIIRGDSEELLGRLEHGELDLVFGRLASSSPWSKAVHFGQAQGFLGTAPKDEPVPRFAMMHGENGWIMLVAEAGR
jgi:hypothetical protein